MAHINMPSGSVRVRSRVTLSPLGLGLAGVGAFSTVVWAGLFALLLS